MVNHWDVIVVGARCAGATLAARLARSGVRTLVLDSAAPGSDMPMSTHLMQPSGMVVLDELGIGDRVRAVTPASTRFRFALDDAEMIAPMAPPAYCVRRDTLDPLLQSAAQDAGAELRFRHKVVELAYAGERVSGVVVQTPAGRETLHADLVVGADGFRSTIARLTGAPTYLTEESTRAGYWSYYRAPASWSQPWDAMLEHRGQEVRYVFRANGDLLVLVYVGPKAEVTSWGRAYQAKLADAFARSPSTAALCAGEAPIGKTMGLLGMQFYYRKPVGPGYALVGDAGHFKDFVTGQGMSDAVLDAVRLHDAIVAPVREQALEHYWRARDVATLPLHLDAIAQGRVGYNSPFMRWVIERVGKSPAILDRFGALQLREIDPDQLIPMASMLRFMAAALFRGRFDVLAGFMEIGRGLANDRRELAARKTLLHDAQQKLENALSAQGAAQNRNTQELARKVA